MLFSLFVYLVLFFAVESIVYYGIFKKIKRPAWRHFLPQGLLVTMLIVTIMRCMPYFDMGKATQLYPENKILAFSVLAITVMLVWTVGIAYFRKRIVLVKRAERCSLFTRILTFTVTLLSVALVTFATWFRSFFGQLSPEQFLFNLQSPVTGTAEGMSFEILFVPGFIIIAVGIVLCYLCFSSHCMRSSKQAQPRRFKTKKVLLATSLILIASLTYVVVLLRLDSVARTYMEQSTYIEKNYVDVRRAKPKFPAQKRNLIHIYLESVENSYFDTSLGGHMPQNLMPDLAELVKEGVHFSHNEKMGGPHQTYGSGWSVASMVNMMCGIPLKVAMDGNDYGKTGYFLPGVYNLGDLLKDAGYEQTIMFGADADFGGLTTYFTSHGNFNIFDHKYAKKVGLIPQDYNVWWGYEDDKLFEYAKMELTRLSQTGKPFNFTMETADTHFPNGYITVNTPRPFQSQYANVIAYSQKQAVELVRWIQQQPFYSQTTVVITGDHLSMDKDFFEKFDPKYKRTIFNLILNAPIKPVKTTNRQYSPVDFYPTILSSLGVKLEGERAGLGTNLFSDVPTLIERDGLEKFEQELEKNSVFYNQRFLNEKMTKDLR